MSSHESHERSESTDRCPVWRTDDCAGTPYCPPRCPRFLAPDGTAYTVYDRADCPVDPTAMERYSDGRTGNGAGGLVAVTDGDPVGALTIDGENGEATIVLESETAPIVGTELARQYVARRRVEGADGTTLIYGPPDALARVAGELDGAATLVDDGSVLEVDLASDETARVEYPPDRRGDIPASNDVTALVDPEVVAVYGATDREGSIGRIVLENLVDRFAGSVVPVTDRRESVLGIDTVASLEAFDGGSVDLAVVILPADAALEAVRDAGAAGVDAVAVLSAGFGETDDEGQRRERELRALVERYDLTLIGPNSLGVASTRADLNASFAPSLPPEGGVSVLSHSGAMITAILDWAEAEGVGVRDVVSLGNTAGVDEASLLAHWGRDPDTSVILAYLEDVSNGRTFVRTARAVSRSTPIVALKSGRSEAGQHAAASHTGALVGDDSGFDAAFEAANVIRVDSQRSLYDVVSLLENQPLPDGDRIAVVTNAGGPGVLAADAVADAGLSLATLDDETERRLATTLSDAASISNPVDVLGDADVGRFTAALEAVLASPSVDAAIVVTTPHPLVSQTDLARAVGDVAHRYGTPVVTCFSGGPLEEPVQTALAESGIPNYPDAQRAATALASAASYGQSRYDSDDVPQPIAADHTLVGAEVESAIDAGRTTLGAASLSILDAYGVSTPTSTVATTRADAIDAADELDGPMAMKVVAPDLVHKTDLGGVAVDVPADSVGETYDHLLETVRANAPEATVRGVLIQEMAPDGVECLVGVTRHPRFGPLVTFGLGGVLVEHLEDVAHGLAPLSRAEARALVHRIDAASVLEGARGSPPADLDALADAVVRLSWLALEHPELGDLEVNPLVATPDDVIAVDFHASLERF